VSSSTATIMGSEIHAEPLGLLVAFGAAGMLSFVSPCVLPMVPGYVSMVSGLSAAQLEALGSSDIPDAEISDAGGSAIVRQAKSNLDLRVERDSDWVCRRLVCLVSQAADG
jgi:cytochrome c biogenesis protein CcdA